MRLMMNKFMSHPPKLLKARIFHTWLFAVPVIAALLCARPLYNFADFTAWPGYVLLIAAMVGRCLCTMYIGGRKNDQLLAIGPYAVVRNPLYVASFLGVLGIGLVSGMMAVLLLLVLAFVFYYRVVVAREEAFLAEKFGADFTAYCARTPRWWPDWRLWHTPDEITVKPKMVFISLRDGMWFVLAMPLLDFIEKAHLHGLLPHLWHLP